MNPFKCFLIRCNKKRTHQLISFLMSVALAIVGNSCSSMGHRKFLYSDPSYLDDVSNGVESSSDFQRKIYSLYCKGQRQNRKASIQIRSIVPMVPKGLSLELADRTQKQILQKRDEALRLAFDLMTLSPDTYEAKAKRSGMRPTYFKKVIHHGEYDYHFFKYNSSSQDAVRTFKEIEGRKVGTAFGKGYNFGEPVFILTTDEKILLIFSGNMALKSDSFINIPELSSLRLGYTFLMPQEAQNELFHLARRPTSANRTLGTNRNTGELSSEKAIIEQDSAWSRYFTQFTSIKEAPSDDPQLTGYEISLDLNNFCVYGRHLDDLMSR